MTELSEEAAKACERLLGMTVQRVERPGGGTRRSVRVFLNNCTVIATRRRHSDRAQLEAKVLRALAAQGAPAPKLLSFDGEWLIQEDVGTRRLSQALASASEANGETLLVAALASLAALHQAGRAAQLDQQVVAIGSRDDWLSKLATTPERLGEKLQMPAPMLPTDRFVDLLRPHHPAFIKWDARPANAIARADGSVMWFDWEHCSCRNPLDDVAWLLCDEYTPDWPEVEARIIAKILPSFLNGSSREAAHDYLMTFGTLHSCVRLSLILSEKADGPWWNAEQCLNDDSVGVTLEATQRICRRGARWARQGFLTGSLCDWFDTVAEKVAKLPGYD